MKKRCDNLYDVKRSTTCKESAIYMTYEGCLVILSKKKTEIVSFCIKSFHPYKLE